MYMLAKAAVCTDTYHLLSTKPLNPPKPGVGGQEQRRPAAALLGEQARAGVWIEGPGFMFFCLSSDASCKVLEDAFCLPGLWAEGIISIPKSYRCQEVVPVP